MVHPTAAPPGGYIVNSANHGRRGKCAAWQLTILCIIFSATVIGITMDAAAPSAQAAAPSACWENRFFSGYQDTFAGPITHVGKLAYTAGAGPFSYSPGSQASVDVRAINLPKRYVWWVDGWSPTPFDDSPVGLVHVKNFVVVAARTGLNNLDAQYRGIAMRAYTLGNPVPIWNDRCTGGATLSYEPNGPHDALLAFGENAVVAGNCDPTETGVLSGLLRAYNAQTGTVAWQVVDASVTQLGIARDSTHIFDLVLTTSGSLALRAYDGASGALLWQATPVTPSGDMLRATHITAGSNQVFVAVRTSSGGVVTRKLFAFHASSGVQAWEVDPAHDVESLAVLHRRLFVAQSGNNAFARAYRASTGVLLWEDAPGSATDPYLGQVVATGPRIVLFAGTRFQMSLEDASHIVVRAYTPRGHFLWEQGETTTAKLDATAHDVAWVHGLTIVSGMTGSVSPGAYGTHDGIVRICRSSHH